MKYFLCNFKTVITRSNIAQILKSQVVLKSSCSGLSETGIGCWIWLSQSNSMKDLLSWPVITCAPVICPEDIFPTMSSSRHAFDKFPTVLSLSRDIIFIIFHLWRHLVCWLQTSPAAQSHNREGQLGQVSSPLRLRERRDGWIICWKENLTAETGVRGLYITSRIQ